MWPPSESHAAGLYVGHTSRNQGVDRNHNERAEIIQNGARRVRRVPYQAVEGTNRNTLVSCTRLVKCGRVEAVRFRFRRKVEQRDRGSCSQRTPLLPGAYMRVYLVSTATAMCHSPAQLVRTATFVAPRVIAPASLKRRNKRLLAGSNGMLPVPCTNTVKVSVVLLP